MREIMGRVHSVETLGTRDGPGLRCVFFLAGCNFRCGFCQNPDTWTQHGSRRMGLKEVKERLLPLLPYLQQGSGGITVSGGEPTQQADFVLALFQLAHQLGLHTVLDTNGTCPHPKRQAILAETDLVLLDVKASTEALHRTLTGKSLQSVLQFGHMAASRPDRLIIRRVLLPGINDTAAELSGLADYALSLPHRPKIELIPYHRLGVHKWKELGYTYPLAHLKPPTTQQWKKATEKLLKKGLEVYR